MTRSFQKYFARYFNIRVVWKAAVVLILAASSTYIIFGTPARLQQRFSNWQPDFGTLNGLDYMQQGSYIWLPKERYEDLPEVKIELRYDWEAIQWLMENVRGNLVIAEAAETDFYLAGATRVATMTGLSGINGFHEFEQRYAQDVLQRNALHIEFWESPEQSRIRAIIDELDIALIYVGQLESHLHEPAIERLAQMQNNGLLTTLYQNERVVIYAVPDKIWQADDGKYYPVPAP